MLLCLLLLAGSLTGGTLGDVGVEVLELVEVPAASASTFAPHGLRFVTAHGESTQVLRGDADVSRGVRRLEEDETIDFYPTIHARNNTPGQHYASMRGDVR